MKFFILLCGIYNSLAILFLIPGILSYFNIDKPQSDFWLLLSSLLGLFSGVVLILSSRDLLKFASFPFWNGITRLIFALSGFVFGFALSSGITILIIIAGDIILSSVCLIGLPKITGYSILQLLKNDLR